MTITVEGPNGATVEFPDGTSTETINQVMSQHFGGGPSASGAADAFTHGAKDIVNSDLQTAKQFMGVGDGPTVAQDPNYQPAEVINGWNPLKWNYDQLPQKVAEEAPGLAQHIAAGTAGAKAGKAIGGAKGALVGGILGSAASLWASEAGDAAKKDAVARTGDPNAEPNAADLTRAGLTSGASALAQSALPLRFVPGANKVTAVGAQGALDAVKKYLATTAVGGATGAAGNAIDQVGNTIGTDKGLTVDPAQVGDAAIGGAATAGVMGAPRAAADAASAAALRNFGGANLDATKAYAQRLQDAGTGFGGLGKEFGGSKIDFTAHEAAKDNIKRELNDAANAVRKQTQLSPDADNALQRAQEGKPLTPDDISLIDSATAGAPDGANTAYLARQMHVAQMAQDRGSYDPTHRAWSGGVSGVLDKNLGFLLNPTRLAAGTLATGFGMHLLGTSNPMFAGAAAGSYLGARGIDAMAGMRSPAKAFADRFADANAAVRLPTAQPPAPPAPPSPPSQPPAGPWGPRPLPQQSVPAVAPPQPAPQPAPAPQLSPMALSMLKQTLKTNAAAQPPAPTPPPAAPQLSPMALSMLKKTLQANAAAQPTEPASPEQPAEPQLPQFNPIALSMLKQQMKNKFVPPTPEQQLAGVPAPQASEPQPAPAPAAPITPGTAKWKSPQVTELPQFNSTALSMLKQKLKASSPQAASAPPTKITKQSAGSSVQVSDPPASSDPWAGVGAYTPIPEASMRFKGLSPPAIADMASKSDYADLPALRKQSLITNIIATHAARDNAIKALIEQMPHQEGVLQQLNDQLHEPGNADQNFSRRAIKHYSHLLSPDEGAKVRAHFDRQDVKDAIWPPKKQRKSKTKNDSTEGAA